MEEVVTKLLRGPEAEAQGVAPPHLEQLREGMQHMMSLTNK